MNLSTDPLPVRVMALHALAYCERLFYLEEVEELRVADAKVYAGRTEHREIELAQGEERRSFEMESEALGLKGKVDAVQHREGGWTPYEYKRGRPRKADVGKGWEAWEADRLQVAAYGMLLEEALGIVVAEGRVRYLAEQVTVRVPLDDALREAVVAGVARARDLRATTARPPVTTHEGRCGSCSLAPVCLPEEERLAEAPERDTVRLFPEHPEGRILHITRHDLRLGRSGDVLTVTERGGGVVEKVPFQDLGAIVIHGYAQISTQLLHACAYEDKPVHWLTPGGSYVGGLSAGPGGVQRRLRQYEALRNGDTCLRLARATALAKVQGQLRYLLRASREVETTRGKVQQALTEIRMALHQMARAEDIAILRGYEGTAGRSYFSALPHLLADTVPEAMRPCGRNRRPPQDCFNAVLSFGYSLLQRSVMQALLSVGLEPAFGFYHTPRSAAHPLVLDVMELFRVPVWDLTVIGSINRLQWDPKHDFATTATKVWLSDLGRRKAIQLFERRLEDTWKHPVTGYSLSWARTMELEARLLEKEWTGKPGLYGQARLR
jgi:CRISP-associated protein Cas1